MSSNGVANQAQSQYQQVREGRVSARDTVAPGMQGKHVNVSNLGVSYDSHGTDRYIFIALQHNPAHWHCLHYVALLAAGKYRGRNFVRSR